MKFSANLEGLPEVIINEMIERGVAQNRMEALRMCTYAINEKLGLVRIDEYLETMRLKERMDAEDNEMERAGKKPLSRKEALGKYAKYLKE